MRNRLRAHQFLVHVKIPRSAAGRLVTDIAAEALAALVARIPEPLHYAENPETRPCAFMKRLRAWANARASPTTQGFRHGFADRPPGVHRVIDTLAGGGF